MFDTTGMIRVKRSDHEFAADLRRLGALSKWVDLDDSTAWYDNGGNRVAVAYYDNVACTREIFLYRPPLAEANRVQYRALKALYDRAPIYATAEDAEAGRKQTYREFRRTTINSFGTLIVRWANMTIGIEPDGYTHS